MLFNSFEYLFFLPITFLLYWFVFQKKVRVQNLFLIFVSYIFYGLWDYRFLLLIFSSTLVDYVVGLQLFKYRNNTKLKKKWLYLSLAFNLGLLATFKYFNFFLDSFINLASNFGYSIGDSWTLKIILPVGISFYTFQTLSYSLDIYYKRLTPTKDLISFTAFVSFFPQLVAGPIERASNLLGQIKERRIFSAAQIEAGGKLILWGLFKKMVIADAMAPMVDDIFTNYQTQSTSTLILGLVFFSFQVYGDFSGYSDIAIGTAKMFGIELMSNFKFPNFSRNVAEYWQRWHISLSTWFRHYVYIPLGGSRVAKCLSVRNIIIIFLISGFWHGANWTFIAWGALHALFYIPVFLMGHNRKYAHTVVAEHKWFPNLVEIGQILLTFTLVTFSRIFFRSPSITDAFGYLNALVSNTHLSGYSHPVGYRMVDYYILLLLFVGYEYFIRKDERNPFPFKYKGIRLTAYASICLAILLFYENTSRAFIYFQF
ncbi:MBOAT family protein [Flavobacterium sp. ASW18X]|nr:MBOAT family O-acyltransferase [Flavobacterium sp. ASW18X]TKD65553.1 MBOAT family protein [Flavobacterium sp. ASW18X]